MGKLLGVHIGVYQLHPDSKRTLVAMAERTGLSGRQVTDEDYSLWVNSPGAFLSCFKLGDLGVIPVLVNTRTET